MAAYRAAVPLPLFCVRGIFAMQNVWKDVRAMNIYDVRRAYLGFCEDLL